MDFDRAFDRSSLPELDRERCWRDVWGPAGCDAVPDTLKLPLFTLALAHGVERAVRSLQYAAGVFQDGHLCQRTLLAVQTSRPDCLLFRFIAAAAVADGG